MLALRPCSPPPYLAPVPQSSTSTLVAFPRQTRPRRRLQPFVLASAPAGQRGRRRSDDDYHATVRSLNSRGRHKPRKSLGQHYMLNSSVNEELVNVAGVGEGDVVLEIGPGTGSLTSVLINAGATVVAVEKDPQMAMLVQERFGSTDRLMVLQEDFTKCHIHLHLSSFLEKNHMERTPFAKDETASRLADCSLRTSEYRPINIFVNFYSDPEYKFKVERTNFFPQPNVDAAVIRFKLKPTTEYPKVSSRRSFFSMVSSAFNGKRKMLRKSLQHICPSGEIEAALSSIGQPVTARPEELTLDDFVSLHNLIVKV